MGGRPGSAGTESLTPGPGAYSAGSDTSKNKPPAFTMSGRNSNERVSSEAPGPGAYDPRLIYLLMKAVLTLN